MTTNTDFPTWLLLELKKRNWLQSELARRAGISRQTVSEYINGKRKYYEKEILVAIAQAFEIREEDVFIAAGAYSPKPGDDTTLRQIEHLYHTLRDPANKTKALEYLLFLRVQERQAIHDTEGKRKAKSK